MNQQQSAAQSQQWAVRNILTLRASINKVQTALVVVSKEATEFTGAIQEHGARLMGALNDVGTALVELHSLAQSMADQAGDALTPLSGRDH